MRDVNREFSLDLPESDNWHTLAGLCITIAKEIPAAGARVKMPDGTVLEVVDAFARRVRSIRVHLRADAKAVTPGCRRLDAPPHARENRREELG